MPAAIALSIQFNGTAIKEPRKLYLYSPQRVDDGVTLMLCQRQSLGIEEDATGYLGKFISFIFFRAYILTLKSCCFHYDNGFRL